MSGITGVTFGEHHSYRDWGLKLKEMEIGLPPTKTAYIDVPGMNGQLDVTEAQNGGVVFGSRELKFTFDARDCDYHSWSTLISTIATAIQGQKLKIVPDTDSLYAYEGRCSIETTKTNEVTAEIVITAQCGPFKNDYIYEDGDWLWDPFSFVDGVIRKANVYTIVTSGQQVTLIGFVYNEPLEVVVMGAVTKVSATIDGSTVEAALQPGRNIVTAIPVEYGRQTLTFTGTGTVKIIQRGGII